MYKLLLAKCFSSKTNRKEYSINYNGTQTNCQITICSQFFAQNIGNPECIHLFYRCAIPGLINDSYEVRDEYHESIINFTIPPAKPNDKGVVYDKCHIYTADRYDVFGIENDTTTPSNRTKVKCDRWVYDTSLFTSTLAAEVK